MGGTEYGLPETSGYFVFSRCKTTDKQNQGRRRGTGKQRRLQWVLRQQSQGLGSQEIPVPAASLVGARGGQQWAEGNRTCWLLGKCPELGWDHSDLGSLPSAATSSSCSLGHISSGCFGRNHHPPSGVPTHQDLP